MIKKIIGGALILGVSFTSVFAGEVLVNREIQTSGGQIEISKGINLDVPDNSFNENVNYQVREVSTLGLVDINPNLYEDVSEMVVNMEVKNKSGEMISNLNNDVVISYNLSGIENPILLHVGENQEMKALTFEENAGGSYIFKLNGDINGNYQIFNSLDNGSGEIDLLGGLVNVDESSELIIDNDNNDGLLLGVEESTVNKELTPVNVTINDKEKGSSAILMLLLLVFSFTVGAMYTYKKA